MKIRQIWINFFAAFAILALVGCSSVSAGDAAGQWENSLAPQGDSRFELVLTDDGSAAFKILLPDDAGTIDIKAADMLKQA